MADIFISYSQKNLDEVRLLAAFLEAQGYSVWWDKRLEGGDQFRNEIMAELNAARAVIVVWSAESAQSIWVQSEAGRAHGDRKLVPVKLRLMSYADIPPPFENLHTPNLDDREAVLSAVQLQLAKPAAAPVLWKQVRYEALTWLGIGGSAVTIFTNVDGVLKLANWAQWISIYWHQILSYGFNFILRFIDISLPPELTGFTAVTFFLSSIILQNLNKIKQTSKDRTHLSYLKSILSQLVFLVICFTVSMFGIYPGSNVVMYIIVCIVVVIPIITSYKRKNFYKTLFVCLFFLSLIYIFLLSDTNLIEGKSGFFPTGPGGLTGLQVLLAYYLFIVFIMPAMFCVVPREILIKRLKYISIVFLLLLGLNQLAKMGIDTLPPSKQAFFESHIISQSTCKPVSFCPKPPVFSAYKNPA